MLYIYIYIYITFLYQILIFFIMKHKKSHHKTQIYTFNSPCHWRLSRSMERRNISSERNNILLEKPLESGYRSLKIREREHISEEILKRSPEVRDHREIIEICSERERETYLIEEKDNKQFEFEREIIRGKI
jgi:hypothetical protein